jgi:energy-coupling factor transporter transmembrane protein EcfT
MLLRFEAILVLGLILGPMIVDAWPAIAVLFTFAYWGVDGDASATKSEVVRNFGLLLVAFVALPLAIWRAKTADRQANIANEQARIAERGQFTDRFSRAVDNMASEHMAIRVGGIYALFQLAEEAEGADHSSLMEMLCAFVRSAPTITASSDGHFREDVQDILDWLFNTDFTHSRHAAYNIDISGANLSGADLSEAKLAWANLRGAYLTQTNLSRAVLSGTDFKDVKGAPDLSKSCADPANPPINLPDDAKLPEVWRPRPSGEGN